MPRKSIVATVAAVAIASLLAVPASPAPQAAATRTAADPAFDFSAPDVLATGLSVPWGLAFLPDGSGLVSERTTSPQQKVVLSGITKASFHDGGRIHFGPDGMLYAGTGDAGQRSNAQNPDTPAGKILRMRPDGSPAPDNPDPDSVVYTLGHRNVQGLAWGGGHMYASEFGQNTWDEINHITAGANYGWPEVEGEGGEPAYRDPIVTWSTSEASPSGATVAGDTLYAAALGGRRLWMVPLDGDGGTSGPPSAVLQGTYGRLRTVAVGPDGWLWVMTSNRDGRGTPTPADDRIVRFPPITR